MSSVAHERLVVEATVKVFDNQTDVKSAFLNNEIATDTVVVVHFQGPKANGMPELHNLTPILGILQERGLKVALVTDGRMSRASGKVPAAIHVTPEAYDAGPIAKLQDGDVVRVDASSGVLDILDPIVLSRQPFKSDLSASHIGMGRELFGLLRASVGPANEGTTVFQAAQSREP